MKDLKNEYEIMKFYQMDQPTHEKNVKYVHGLAIEGAYWDHVG